MSYRDTEFEPYCMLKVKNSLTSSSPELHELYLTNHYVSSERFVQFAHICSQCKVLSRFVVTSSICGVESGMWYANLSRVWYEGGRFNQIVWVMVPSRAIEAISIGMCGLFMCMWFRKCSLNQ